MYSLSWSLNLFKLLIVTDLYEHEDMKTAHTELYTRGTYRKMRGILLYIRVLYYVSLDAAPSSLWMCITLAFAAVHKTCIQHVKLNSSFIPHNIYPYTDIHWGGERHFSLFQDTSCIRVALSDISFSLDVVHYTFIPVHVDLEDNSINILHI